MFCAYCGTQSLRDEASFCFSCGKPLAFNRQPSAPFRNAEPHFQVPREEESTGRFSQGFVARLNTSLDSVGLWLDSKLRRVFHKPMTKTRGRAWFIVAAFPILFFLLLYLAPYVGGSTLLGVQTSHFWQVLFLITALGLVLYLTTIPKHWRTALQILMWLCVVRGIAFGSWNLFMLPDAVPPGASGLDLLLILIVFIALAPFIGFFIVAPATYVWIRTRGNGVSLPK